MSKRIVIPLQIRIFETRLNNNISYPRYCDSLVMRELKSKNTPWLWHKYIKHNMFK